MREIFSFESFLRLRREVESLKGGGGSMIESVERQVEKLKREHREEMRRVREGVVEVVR
jgi:hypothetical protein